MEADTWKLRDFANMLEPADFSKIKLADDLRGGMEEAQDPDQFISAWAPHLAGFADDLLRGVEAFRTVARNTADRIEATDERSANIFALEIGKVRGQQPSESGDLSLLPHPRPLAPPPPPPAELPDLREMQERSIFGNVGLDGQAIPL